MISGLRTLHTPQCYQWRFYRPLSRGQLIICSTLILIFQQVSLFAASYAELEPNLDSETLAQWERDFTDQAQTQLADYIWFAHAQGYGCRVNYEKARHWHAKAIEKDLPLARLFQVLSSRNRHWVAEFQEPDPQNGNRELQQFLKNSHAYFKELADNDIGARCWYGLAESELAKMEDAIVILESAAKDGYKDADAWLGYIYCNRKRDNNLGFKHLNIAHEANIYWASTELGDCYNRGWGTPTDRSQAEALYKSASEHQDRKGMLRYAQMQNNDAATLPYSIFASELGDPEASHHLAWRYENGRGTSIQKDKAIALHLAIYQRFAESARWPQYPIRAAAELGRIYDLQAETENNPALYQLAAQWYRTVQERISNPKDYRVLQAHLALGKHALNGLGTEVNFATAFTHFTQATEGKLADAHMYLADCHRLGQGTEANIALAIENYEKALELYKNRGAHVPHCQEQLALCLEQTNLDKAIEAYQSYSKNGNAQASYRLIELYRQHKIHLDEIPALLAKAADQGHPHAKQELDRHIIEADANILNDF